MRFKTLLLGSAAVIASAAGSAQAADLSVAEPVDYVRVCDAFGEGYWYIPGTDTCIAISGKVESGVKFGDNFESDADDLAFDDDGDLVERDHDWGLYTRTDVNVEAKSMTDWGPLTAFITMRADFGSAESYDEGFYLDEGYLSLGPLLIGYTQSVFDVQGGGYTDSGLDLSDDSVNQVQLSWAFNGFGLAIGIEDPADRYGSSADSIPAVALALTTEFAGLDAGLSFLYAPIDWVSDDTIAVEGVVSGEWGIFELQLAGIWNDGAGFDNDFVDGDNFVYTGDGWAVSISSKQNWQSNFYTAETFVWNDWDHSQGDWGAAFTAGYSPVDSLWFIADASTVDEGDSWDFTIFAEKTFGPNG